jgi:capsular polysaccharide transport system permease protein
MSRLTDLVAAQRGRRVSLPAVNLDPVQPIRLALEYIRTDPTAFARTDRLIDHLSVIWALMLRQLRAKYQFNSMGFFMELLRPTIVVVAHYIFFSVIPRSIPLAVPVEVFVLGGFTTWFAYSTTYLGMLHTVSRSGNNRIPGVTRMHLRVSRACFILLIHLGFILGAVFILKFAGDDLPFPNVPLIVLTLTCAVAMGFGFGTFMEAISRVVPVMEPIAHIFIWVVYIASGMYGPYANDSPITGQYFWFNPVLHAVEYSRYALYGGYPVTQLSLKYLVFWALVLPLLGLLALRRVSRMAHK